MGLRNLGFMGLCAYSFAFPLPTRGEEWKYVTPAAGDSFEHPPLRAIALSAQKPDDLKETVRYRGARQRYAQIRYGSPNSIRVTLVLDEIGPGETDLYVDANRDRRIEAIDRVAGDAGVWRIPLAVAVSDGLTTKSLPRTVILKLGRVTKTLSYATCGCIEGKTSIGDKQIGVRRMDGDGNGFFSDAQDRLWIDLNADGRWDPLDEQFLYSPILTLGPNRYAVRSDVVGLRLNFEKLEGTGTLKIAVKPPELAERIQELTATLTGRDGSVVSLPGKEAAITVPIGEYRMSVLTVSLKDDRHALPMTFVFSDNGGRQPHKWYKVEKAGAQTIDPIGKLEFATGVEAGKVSSVGKEIKVRPELYTGDGLLINTAYFGEHSRDGIGGPSARVTLLSASGLPIELDHPHTCGFA